MEYGELDTIVLHTAKGQIINLSLQTGRNGFSMVIAHDTLSLKRADSCTFEEYKDHERSVYRLPYQLEFRYHVEDSIFHFPEPLEVYELSDLSVLAGLPDDKLSGNSFLVKYFSQEENFETITCARVFLIQLDDDPEPERIFKYQSADGWTSYHEVFNDLNGVWKKCGTIETARFAWDDTIITNLFPFFGVYDHGWGTGYASTGIDLYKLEKDTILHCGSFDEFSAYHEYVGEYWKLGHGFDMHTKSIGFDLAGNKLTVTQKVFFNLNYPDDSSEIKTIDGEKVQLTYYFNPSTKKFFPVKNQKWITRDPWDNMVFDLDGYVDKRLRLLAKTGTETERRLFSNYSTKTPE